MDELYAFLLAYRAIIGAAVLTAIFIILIISWWDEVKTVFQKLPLQLAFDREDTPLSQKHRNTERWLVRVRNQPL